jgi:predicted RNA-binding protein with RPS1 domain
MDRRKLFQMGYSCLADREPGIGVSFVWERLFDEAKRSPELDRGELLRWGQRFLRRNPSQGDWTFVWERLYKEPGLSAEDRQDLSHAGFLWLQAYEERDEWVFIWKQLVESRALPEGVDRATLVALGQRFLAHREEAKSWMWVWSHLAGISPNHPTLLDANVLAAQGNRWLSKHQTENTAPTIAARVLALSSLPEKYDALASSLAGWLAENKSSHLIEIAARILMPHAKKLARSGESGAAPGCIKLHAWLGRLDDALTPLEFMMNQWQPILGTISGRRRAGYTVDLAGTHITAFLPDLEVWPDPEIGAQRPGSHESLRLGLKKEFRIVRIDRSRAQVFVSLRGVDEKELREHRQRWLGERKLGEIVKGTVKKHSPYGVFVSLAVLVGMVPIGNLSWLRLVSHYGLLKSGQEIELVISRIDVENVTLSLALKPAPSESWDEVKRAVSKQRVYEGQVIALAGYGVYVEIEKGVVGLLHGSAIYNAKFPKKPGDTLAVGRVMRVAVREISSAQQQILLRRC